MADETDEKVESSMGEEWTCPKCGHDSGFLQMRVVAVTVGRIMLSRGVVPAEVCGKCGEPNVRISLEVTDDKVNLVPADVAQVSRLSSEAMDVLKACRGLLDGLEGDEPGEVRTRIDSLIVDAPGEEAFDL